MSARQGGLKPAFAPERSAPPKQSAGRPSSGEPQLAGAHRPFGARGSLPGPLRAGSKADRGGPHARVQGQSRLDPRSPASSRNCRRDCADAKQERLHPRAHPRRIRRRSRHRRSGYRACRSPRGRAYRNARQSRTAEELSLPFARRHGSIGPALVRQGAKQLLSRTCQDRRKSGTGPHASPECRCTSCGFSSGAS